MAISDELRESNHLLRIEEAIGELAALTDRTKAPAPLPHQFIGTVVDNAAVLLTAPANSLDGGGRWAAPSEDETWFSIIKALHRGFLGDLQTAVEAGLSQLCADLGLEVKAHARERAAVIAGLIRSKVDPTPIMKELRDIEGMASKHPSFNDHLNPVVDLLPDKQRRKMWRAFFGALSIARNRASHSDTSLTDLERNTLTAGGFASQIDDTGNFVMNARVYAQLATFCMDFFDEVLAAPGVGSGASAS